MRILIYLIFTGFGVTLIDQLVEGASVARRAAGNDVIMRAKKMVADTLLRRHVARRDSTMVINCPPVVHCADPHSPLGPLYNATHSLICDLNELGPILFQSVVAFAVNALAGNLDSTGCVLGYAAMYAAFNAELQALQKDTSDLTTALGSQLEEAVQSLPGLPGNLDDLSEAVVSLLDGLFGLPVTPLGEIVDEVGMVVGGAALLVQDAAVPLLGLFVQDAGLVVNALGNVVGIVTLVC